MGTDTRMLQSLGCYLGMVLLVGQLVLRAAFAIPFDTLFLGITGILIFGPMFGPDFVVAVIRAVRGSGGTDGRGRSDAS